MKVFVTGGAGFVGRSVIDALLDKGHSVHALVNRAPLAEHEGEVISFPGGMFNAAALDAAMSGCDAIIHLVGIIKENLMGGITFDRIHVQGTKEVVDAANRAGIMRFLHMSALGAAPSALSNYHLTKFQAEVCVSTSELDWTIFQPSLIHGPGGEFTRMEQDWATGNTFPFLFMPYFNDGLLGWAKRKRVQPIFVEDVARAVAQALEDPQTIDQVYQLGGPERMTWPQMHRSVAEVVGGRARATLAIPVWFAEALIKVVPARFLPYTHDQLLMSQQDNVCDLTKFTQTFGWTPQRFARSLRSYVTY